jgi:hypothetical protein
LIFIRAPVRAVLAKFVKVKKHENIESSTPVCSKVKGHPVRALLAKLLKKQKSTKISNLQRLSVQK